MSPWQQRLGTYTEKLDSKKLKLKSGPCEENRVLRSDPHGRGGILRVLLVSNRTPHTRVTSSITITWIKTLECSRKFQLCSASQRWPCIRKALQNDKENEHSHAVTLINNATLGRTATLVFGRCWKSSQMLLWTSHPPSITQFIDQRSQLVYAAAF